MFFLLFGLTLLGVEAVGLTFLQQKWDIDFE